MNWLTKVAIIGKFEGKWADIWVFPSLNDCLAAITKPSIVAEAWFMQGFLIESKWIFKPYLQPNLH